MFVQLLGPVSSGPEPASISAVASKVQAGVLAHLALTRGAVLSWESLSTRVWDEPPPSSRNAIQVAISKLRGRLGPDYVDSGPGGLSTAHRLHAVDWLEAEQDVGQARHAWEAGNAANALSLTDRVLSASNAEPLAGLDTLASDQAKT